MAEREVLESVFQNAAVNVPGHLKPQLAYRHMIALADTLDGWAQDKRNSPERTATLLGQAESFRNLAEAVGPSWNPPEPATLSIMGFIARQILDEPCPPPTPQLDKPDIPLRRDSVLASPLAMFRGWGLAIACPECAVTRPIAVNEIAGFAKEREQVASVIARLRCYKCGTKPSRVELLEGSNSPTGRNVKLI